MMNQTPISGFPENPDKKNKEEQIRILVERHNFLVDQVTILEKEFNNKELNLKKFRKIVHEDLAYHRKEINDNKELIRKVVKLKKEITGDFKNIVKTIVFQKLEKRAYGLKYEDFIYRDELMRKIKNQSIY